MYNICRTDCYFNIIARAFKYSGYKIPQAPITVHTARTNCLRIRKMNSITPPSDRQAGNRATVGTFEWLVGCCSSSSGWLTSLSLELPLSAVSLVLQNLISLIQDQFTSEEKRVTDRCSISVLDVLSLSPCPDRLRTFPTSLQVSWNLP